MGISGADSRGAGSIEVLDCQCLRLWRRYGIASQLCDNRSPSVLYQPVSRHHRGGSLILGYVIVAPAEDRQSETCLDSLYSRQTYVAECSKFWEWYLRIGFLHDLDFDYEELEALVVLLEPSIEYSASQRFAKLPNTQAHLAPP